MKKLLLVLFSMATVAIKAGGAQSLGVIPSIQGGIAQWVASNGFGVGSYLQNSGINNGNYIGFQFKDKTSGTMYFLSDQQIPAFKIACAQTTATSNPTTSINASSDGGKTWSTTSLAASKIAAGVLNYYKPGSMISYRGKYASLSMPFSNTSYNMIQLHPRQIGKDVAQGGTSALTAMNLESILYYYPALTQIWLGRVAAGVSGLQGLFSTTPVTYNGQSVANNTIYTNFMQQAQFYIQASQYALAALGLPQQTGTLNPYVVSNQSSTNTPPPPTTINQGSSGAFSSNSVSGNTVSSTPTNNSAAASSFASTITTGNSVLSLLDTFAGIVVVNNVPDVTQNGVTYSAGFGPTTLTLPTGAQPIPSKPMGLAFYQSSVFIPVAGTADQWSATPNGYGRTAGFNYTIAAYSGNTVTSASVGFGTLISPYNFSVGFAASDTTNNTIVIYNNGTATGEPIATLNLANFFAVPTPWALVVQVSGFITNNPTLCLNVVPAAMVNGVQPLVNSYLATQATAQTPVNPTNGVISLNGVICQSNGQAIVQQPELQGVIKLNPYDFPLQFSQAGSNGVTALPSMTSPFTFSMANVYDSAGGLYGAAFPTATLPGASQPTSFYARDSHGDYSTVGLYIDGKDAIFSPYPMGYLILQGLMNGYLMVSTVTPQQGSVLPTVPLTTALQQPITLGTNLATNLGGMTSLATPYTQPTAAQWFATQGFDYLMLRSLMVMRCIATRVLYMTEYALPYMYDILKNPNQPYPADPRTKLPAANAVYFGQNSAKNYNVFIPARNPNVEVPAVPSVALCPAATQTTTTPANSTTTPTNSSAGTSSTPPTW